MSRLFQGSSVLFYRARSCSQKTLSCRLRTSPQKAQPSASSSSSSFALSSSSSALTSSPSSENVCQSLCADKQRMLDAIQDPAWCWGKQGPTPKRAEDSSESGDRSYHSSSTTTSSARLCSHCHDDSSEDDDDDSPCCRELCREMSEMMSMAFGRWGLGPDSSAAGDEREDGGGGSNPHPDSDPDRDPGPPCAVLTCVRCGQCGYTFCCTCSPTPSVRRLRSEYWSRPEDKYTLSVSVSIYEQVLLFTRCSLSLLCL